MVTNIKKTKMTTLRKELPYILIALIPFIYLAFIWNNLPETVPMHWNGKGEIDRYGSKNELWSMTSMLSGLGYFLFLIIPKIDPKGKLSKMGNKLDNLRLMMALFMSALSMFIIYSVQQAESKPTFIFALIGLLFAGLGNYFKTIKPNYFIGIKTPWTLENEEVWKKTHLFGGKLWFAGGLLIFILSLIIPNVYSFYVLMTVTVIISIIPIIYSYLKFKKLKT
ncbi:immunity protein SdpI [Flavobacterium okayamense]|uniref:Immunity protein SdpI n=2 Tax=Flavobacterium okayamense TaxID=2830782 RepID=A0ABM7S5V1_9FLAO|nr:immunity protein SdpI [Flavobacterium okayamense]